MSNRKFNLERFKAGEPAIDVNEGLTLYYWDVLPTGRIAFKYEGYTGDWYVDTITPEEIEERWTMEPKEEWALYNKTTNRLGAFIYESREETLEGVSADEIEFFEAVRIIRY